MTTIFAVISCASYDLVQWGIPPGRSPFAFPHRVTCALRSFGRWSRRAGRDGLSSIRIMSRCTTEAQFTGYGSLVPKSPKPPFIHLILPSLQTFFYLLPLFPCPYWSFLSQRSTPSSSYNGVHSLSKGQRCRDDCVPKFLYDRQARQSCACKVGQESSTKGKCSH